MFKKPIVTGFAAIAFSIFAVFASAPKARPFNGTPYYRTSLGTCKALGGTGVDFSTSGTNQAKISSSSGTIVSLYSNSTCISQLYFIPE